MTARRPRRSQRDALRQLVTGLNDATEQRKRYKRGTRRFFEAGEAQRRYRRILLDDELFGRFIEGHSSIEGDSSIDPEGNGRTRARPERNS